MTSQIIPVEPFDYIVFGGTGDLSERKLIPALYHRAADGQIVGGSRIIGAARAEMSTEAFRDFARQALHEHVKEADRDEGEIAKFVDRLHYVSVDAKSEKGWEELKALLNGEDRVRAFYLAVGPAIFGDIAEKLHAHGMIGERSRLVIEKPIGHDLASAHELNVTVGRYFDEDQIYRIDHYLGKETVQNLMALRFANALYEPVWNSAHIDHVQITVAETLGVEGRAGYYDKSGAIRDMVQNHLLQLLCLVAMEPPASMNADAVRDEKLKVLRALNPINADNASELTVRGQYTAGAANGMSVPGYLDELEGGKSDTETFVAIKAAIGNWRWAGVPFYLRTGKRLGRRVTEVAVVFKRAPHLPFESTATEELGQNALVIRVQPDEGLALRFGSKVPGTHMEVRDVTMDFAYGESFTVSSPEAYERLILDVLIGEAPLFPRHEEVEQSWRILDPVEEYWAGQGAPEAYPAGTWGPAGADAMLARDGRAWRRP
ncbi:MAG: glucose-6-phosphate dehydrogenase [Nitratireductor sp.]|nr:glucose-6-phosphate dehydrogenase [Nitratireductor sp.]